MLSDIQLHLLTNTIFSCPFLHLTFASIIRSWSTSWEAHSGLPSRQSSISKVPGNKLDGHSSTASRDIEILPLYLDIHDGSAGDSAIHPKGTSSFHRDSTTKGRRWLTDHFHPVQGQECRDEDSFNKLYDWFVGIFWKYKCNMCSN
jgi:hypothetical protein